MLYMESSKYTNIILELQDTRFSLDTKKRMCKKYIINNITNQPEFLEEFKFKTYKDMLDFVLYCKEKGFSNVGSAIPIQESIDGFYQTKENYFGYDMEVIKNGKTGQYVVNFTIPNSTSDLDEPESQTRMLNNIEELKKFTIWWKNIIEEELLNSVLLSMGQTN